MSPLESALRFILACLTCLVVFGSVVVYTFFLICWLMISLPLPETWFHVVEDGLWGWYQSMIVFFCEHCSGIKVYIEGKVPSIKENCLVISNHQCLVDWIVADFLAIRQGMVGHMRYVFKNSIKYYPLYGFGFGVHGGVFVRRDGLYNNENMRKVLNTLIKRKANLYFLIYPEGTRFSPTRKSLLEKSRTFATNSGLQPLSQVLTPRVKAFDCALKTLSKHIHAVYDITLIYNGVQDNVNGKNRLAAPTIWQFLSGTCREVYIRFERFPIDEVVSSIESLENDNPNISGSMHWLHQRFVEKDQLLKKLYEKEATQEPQEDGNPLQHFARSNLPLSYTLPSAICFILAIFLPLYYPLGRTVFFLITTIGTFLFGLYAHTFF